VGVGVGVGVSVGEGVAVADGEDVEGDAADGLLPGFEPEAQAVSATTATVPVARRRVVRRSRPRGSLGERESVTLDLTKRVVADRAGKIDFRDSR
jgi:hypothetical protein